MESPHLEDVHLAVWLYEINKANMTKTFLYSNAGHSDFMKHWRFDRTVRNVIKWKPENNENEAWPVNVQKLIINSYWLKILIWLKNPKNIHSGSKFIHQLLFEKVGLGLIEKIAFISKAHTSTRDVRLWCFSGFVGNGLTLDLDRNIPLIKIIIYNSCSHIIYLHVTPFLASYSVTPTFCVSSFTASMNLFIILCPVYPLSKPSQDASLTFLQTAQPELKY